ncbi:sugar ABC transporter permease [Paenibacillus cisolokensis]|jgi:ABC-type sugar transport system, permease component|uniref:Sugar ABC transporter permease n=2 Tax=Paenibacillus cisolokensis TaxID=1658519 RepID=A0ABQ4NBL0_9BACL|nr:sugar ABC transporter permease [Paenibacillus cisolokensis]
MSQTSLAVKPGSSDRKSAFPWGGMRDGVVWTVLLIYGILTLYPLFWLGISAFKNTEDFFNRPFGLPQTWRFDNFARAWEASNMGTAFFNSVLVSALSLALTLFVSALASYVLARFSFRLKGWVMTFFVVGMLIPIHSTLVPLFIMMREMKLLNTYAALVLPYTAFALPTAIFVLAAYMLSFPKDVEEAAFIDGTGRWGVFFRMILPISMPAISTVSIISFLHFWNDFSFALVFISKSAMKTLPLSVAILADSSQTDFGLTMAAMVLAVVPTIAIYLMFQDRIMKGMTAGAVKG